MFNERALAELLEGSGLSFKKGMRSFILDCPKCGKKDKLYIRRSDGIFICFYCATVDGFRGKPEFVLRELLNIPLKDLRTTLYGGNHVIGTVESIKINNPWDFENFEELEQPLPLLEWPLDFYPIDHEFSEVGLKYLQNRGIHKNIAELLDIRYNPVRRRVAFPIKRDGKLHGWQGRAIDSEVIPKILTSDGVLRDRVLMFEELLENSEHAIVCEGPIDALKCFLVGGAVATMGKVVSKKQVEIIKNSGAKKIYIALDPDAHAEAKKLSQEFHGLEVFRLLPPGDKKDLGECSLGEICEAFHKAPEFNRSNMVAKFKNPFSRLTKD